MKKALSIFVTLVFALTMVTAAVSANADELMTLLMHLHYLPFRM